MTAKWQYKQAYEAALVTARELKAENAKLREVLESCVVLLTDHQFPHLPELRDETFKAMRELGVLDV